MEGEAESPPEGASASVGTGTSAGAVGEAAGADAVAEGAVRMGDAEGLQGAGEGGGARGEGVDEGSGGAPAGAREAESGGRSGSSHNHGEEAAGGDAFATHSGDMRGSGDAELVAAEGVLPADEVVGAAPPEESPSAAAPPEQSHDDPPPAELSYDVPPPMLSESSREYSLQSAMSRETSMGSTWGGATEGDLAAPAAIEGGYTMPVKKKKKKRVGGIMFAETMVQEKILTDDKEELAHRRAHWKEIQEKALQPLSNDPSANTSPTRTPPPGQALDLTHVREAEALDHARLNAQLLELQEKSDTGGSSPLAQSFDPPSPRCAAEPLQELEIPTAASEDARGSSEPSGELEVGYTGVPPTTPSAAPATQSGGFMEKPAALTQDVELASEPGPSITDAHAPPDWGAEEEAAPALAREGSLGLVSGAKVGSERGSKDVSEGLPAEMSVRADEGVEGSVGGGMEGAGHESLREAKSLDMAEDVKLQDLVTSAGANDGSLSAVEASPGGAGGEGAEAAAPQARKDADAVANRGADGALGDTNSRDDIVSGRLADGEGLVEAGGEAGGVAALDAGRSSSEDESRASADKGPAAVKESAVAQASEGANGWQAGTAPAQQGDADDDEDEFIGAFWRRDAGKEGEAAESQNAAQDEAQGGRVGAEGGEENMSGDGVAQQEGSPGAEVKGGTVHVGDGDGEAAPPGDGGEKGEGEEEEAADVHPPPENRGAVKDCVNEPPSAGCPPLKFPDLTSYISPKEEEEIFVAMSRSILEYAEFWPTARKAGEEGMAVVRDETNAKEYAYMLKRFLLRTWKSEVVVKNLFHMADLMKAAKNKLFAGQSPLIESRLEQQTTKEGYSVQISVPVVSMKEPDWLYLSGSFKHRHLIGDRFFPSDDFVALSGYDAMGAGVESTKTGEALLWENDTAIGLSVHFQPKTERVHWNAMAPANSEGINLEEVTERTRVGGANELLEFVETSKREYRREKRKTFQKRMGDDEKRQTQVHLQSFRRHPQNFTVEDTSGLPMKSKQKDTRSSKEAPRLNDPRLLALTTGASPERKAWTSHGSRDTVRGGARERKKIRGTGGGAAALLKKSEDDAAFRAFLKEHAGRAMVTGPRLAMFRQKFEEHKVRKTKLEAAARYTEFMGEVDAEWQLRADEAPGLDDDEIAELLVASGEGPAAQAQTTRAKGRFDVFESPVHMEEPPKALVAQKKAGKAGVGAHKGIKKAALRTEVPQDRESFGKSFASSLEQSFSKSAPESKAEEGLLRGLFAFDEADADIADTDFDEFLRRPMTVMLSRDATQQSALHGFRSFMQDNALTLAMGGSIKGGFRRGGMRPGASSMPLPMRSMTPPTRLPGLTKPTGQRSNSMELPRAAERPEAAGVAAAGRPGAPGAAMPVPYRRTLPAEGLELGKKDGKSPYAQRVPGPKEDVPKRKNTNRSVNWHPTFSRISAQGAVGEILTTIGT